MIFVFERRIFIISFVIFWFFILLMYYFNKIYKRDWLYEFIFFNINGVIYKVGILIYI